MKGSTGGAVDFVWTEYTPLSGPGYIGSGPARSGWGAPLNQRYGADIRRVS